MGYFSPDADVWLPGHAYIKRITCLWAVKNLLLCFVLLEANKMSRPSVLGEGFHCWCVLCTELEPTRQDLGFVSYPCSWLTPWHGDCLFWTKLSWGFFFDFACCQLCMMYHPEYALYPMSDLNCGNKAVIWFSCLQWEPDFPLACPPEGHCRLDYLAAVCSGNSER